MRVGILGSGFMGGNARACLLQIAGCSGRRRLVALPEKAEKLAAEFGARATTDDLEIVDDPSIDVISNTLPTHLHAQFTIAALQAGKHVLLEKPFALTEADCDAMIAGAGRQRQTVDAGACAALLA